MVPRSEVIRHYEWADIFLLPSLCEGSATSTYEALTAGLPVVCTPNCGSVVRHGTEGYLVPIRDPGAISDRLEALATDAEACRNSQELLSRIRKQQIAARGAAQLAQLAQEIR